MQFTKANSNKTVSAHGDIQSIHTYTYGTTCVATSISDGIFYDGDDVDDNDDDNDDYNRDVDDSDDYDNDVDDSDDDRDDFAGAWSLRTG